MYKKGFETANGGDFVIHTQISAEFLLRFGALKIKAFTESAEV